MKTSTLKTLRQQGGFTIIELMIVVALVALMASFGASAYSGYMDDARGSEAIGDMGRIVLEIEKYRTNNNGDLPASLNDLTIEGKKDPWGKNYIYVPVLDGMDKTVLRKNPAGGKLNSDYDLLSRGPDGKSSKNITKANALDDIIRGNNGGYMGKAEDY